MRRILLLGKDGQLGWELQRSLAPLGELVALGRGGCTSATGKSVETGKAPALCGDLSRPADLVDMIRGLRPDVIVNSAAYTAVDKAESEADVAYAINAAAPGALASAALEVGALLVHFSSDYVFDGSGTAPWREFDRTGPLNVYGRSKLEGEERIRASGCRHLLLRTSWVHSARGSNFAKTVLKLARERDRLKIVDDQIGAPTGADLLADVTAHAIRQLGSVVELAGTYHVAASGETSWYGYAQYVVSCALASGREIRLSSDGLHPIPSSEYPTAAQRPANSRLDCSRLETTFGLRMPTWQAGVERLVDELGQDCL